MKRGSDIVKVIMGDKVWSCTRKMANNIISLGKAKYQKLNVNAIVAVEKGNMIVLQKDVYEDEEEFTKEIQNWALGGYYCHYNLKKNGGK